MNGKETKYFSMFTGVGGFELGISQAVEAINREQNRESEVNQKDQSKKREGLVSKKREDFSEKTGQHNEQFDCEQYQRTVTCIGFSEIDKYASQLLANKFPNIRNYGDATKINPNELPDFDMLCGGFPCQSFSIAGKRRGFEDTRGTMFFEVARILKVKRPKLVFLENVKGLLNHNKGQTFTVIIQTLEELGYRTQWMVLNSKFFGVPQNRERVFIIGSLRDEPRPEILPFRKDNSENIEFEQDSEQNEVASTISSMYAKNQHQSQYVSYTIDSNYWKGTTEKHFKEKKVRQLVYTPKVRRLTPRECESLQGFPQDWTASFSDTQRYKMLGNAVTTKVILAIAKRLL